VVDEEQLELFWEEVRNMGNVILEYAEKRGEERGEKRGEERRAEENARRMIAKGYELGEIAEVTGVSPERLREMV